MLDHIRKEGNNIIWQLHENARKVWELDPRTGVVVEYREEYWRKSRGRFRWVSSRADTWSNPDYTSGGFAFGTMTECPEVPEVTVDSAGPVVRHSQRPQQARAQGGRE